MQAARAVQQHDVIGFQQAGLNRALGDGHGRLARHDGQRRNTGLHAEHGQLLLRGRTAHVERGHQDFLLLALAQPQTELGGGGGLARTLQTDHENRYRRVGGQVDGHTGAAQHLDQMVVDDLDDHLAGRDAFQHVLAHGLIAHGSQEILDHRQGDVGFEQRHAHFAQRRIHVALAQGAAPRQLVEHRAKARGQVLEHRPTPNSTNAQNAVTPVRETRGLADPDRSKAPKLLWAAGP